MMSTRDSRALEVPAGWAAEVEDWRLALRAAGRSPRTIRTRVEHVEQLARAFGGVPGAVSGAELLLWVGGREWAAETRRSHYASFRGFFRWVHGAGRIAVDPSIELPYVRPGQPRPHAAPDLAITIALQSADDRGRLMVRLGSEAGLRRGEIAAVHRRDLLRDLGGYSLLVHGKGERDRIVPITDSLAHAIERATVGGFAFPGRIDGHLSPRRVGEILAELLPASYTGHSLRHAFAARLDQRTRGDLAVIQDLLGHASPATTRLYVPKDLARMRAAVEAASA